MLKSFSSTWAKLFHDEEKARRQEFYADIAKQIEQLTNHKNIIDKQVASLKEQIKSKESEVKRLSTLYYADLYQTNKPDHKATALQDLYISLGSLERQNSAIITCLNALKRIQFGMKITDDDFDNFKNISQLDNNKTFILFDQFYQKHFTQLTSFVSKMNTPQKIVAEPQKPQKLFIPPSIYPDLDPKLIYPDFDPNDKEYWFRRKNA